jgi:hypothetical protein
VPRLLESGAGVPRAGTTPAPGPKREPVSFTDLPLRTSKCRSGENLGKQVRLVPAAAFVVL